MVFKFLGNVMCVIVSFLWMSLQKGVFKFFGLFPSRGQYRIPSSDYPDSVTVDTVDNQTSGTVLGYPSRFRQDEDQYFYVELRSPVKYDRVRLCDSDGIYYPGTVEWTGRSYMYGQYVVLISMGSEESKWEIKINEKLPKEYSLHDCPDNYRLLRLEDIEGSVVSNLRIGDYCIQRHNRSSRNNIGGFIRENNGDIYKLHSVDRNYKSSTVPPITAFDYHLHKVAPPETEIVSEYVKPISGIELNEINGRNKGIQGQRNSCYLDSLLFLLFAFDDELDRYLSDPAEGMDSDNFTIWNTLRCDIIFPLRTYQFVSHYNVQTLRNLIADQTGVEAFRTETRDISECMEALFHSLLHIPPFLYVGHYVNKTVEFNGVYSLEILNDGTLEYATTQQLLQTSAVQMQFYLKETNSLFLQIARQPGKIGGVLPNLYIDIKDLVYDTVKICAGCGSTATLQFWYTAKEIGKTYICKDCATNQGFDLETGVVLPENDSISILEESTMLELVGILCIERSHYNCFARSHSHDQWFFFDSMYERELCRNQPEGRQMEEINVPVVKEMKDFDDWLKTAPACVKEHGSLNPFFESLSKEDLSLAMRVFNYSSIHIYKNFNRK